MPSGSQQKRREPSRTTSRPSGLTREEAKYVIGLLSGYCKMFKGTGIIDAEECIKKVWETFGPYLEEG